MIRKYKIKDLPLDINRLQKFEEFVLVETIERLLPIDKVLADIDISIRYYPR